MTPEQQTQLQELRDHRGPHTLFIRNHALPLLESLVSENSAKDVEIERLKKPLGQAPDPDPLDEENRCDECQNIACVCGDEDEEEDTWGLEYTDTL